MAYRLKVYPRAAEQLLGTCPGRLPPAILASSKVAQRSPDTCCGSQELAQVRPVLIDLGHNLTEFDQTWTKFGQSRPKPVNVSKCWPVLANTCPHVGRCWPNIGQHLVKLGRDGRLWSNFAACWPSGANTDDFRSEHAILGRNWAETRLLEQLFGNLWTTAGRQLGNSFPRAGSPRRTLGLFKATDMTTPAPHPRPDPRPTTRRPHWGPHRCSMQTTAADRHSGGRWHGPHLGGRAADTSQSCRLGVGSSRLCLVDRVE